VPPQHDAFGRPIEPTSDASGRATASAAFAAEPAKPKRRPEGPGQRDPRRPPWRLPYLLALLLVGAGAIGLTLSAAADWADDQPRTHEFALERDPFGPRSLLRAENMRRATGVALDDAADDERVAGILVEPERLLVTLTDPRDQSRWVTVDTAFDVSVHDLETSAYPAKVSTAAASVDPAPALRAVRRHWRHHQPYAHEPSLSLVITTDAFGRGRPRVTGWTVSVRGVAQDEQTLRVTTAGKAVR
jgi:hypothetical protein